MARVLGKPAPAVDLAIRIEQVGIEPIAAVFAIPAKLKHQRAPHRTGRLAIDVAELREQRVRCVDGRTDRLCVVRSTLGPDHVRPRQAQIVFELDAVLPECVRVDDDARSHGSLFRVAGSVIKKPHRNPHASMKRVMAAMVGFSLPDIS
jgi:hypothetical protein